MFNTFSLLRINLKVFHICKDWKNFCEHFANFLMCISPWWQVCTTELQFPVNIMSLYEWPVVYLHLHFIFIQALEGLSLWICPPPLGIKGGNDFCVISQAGGATAKLQEPGWGHIQGGDDFSQSSRGELLYHDELLVFPQNASPWIL